MFGQNLTAEQCGCSCHRHPGMRHIVACCSETYKQIQSGCFGVDYEKLEASLDKKAQHETAKQHHRGKNES
jgi:hypothetical protein